MTIPADAETTPLHPDDPGWQEWAPDWSRRAAGPHVQQETVAPTESVSLRVSGARQADAACRRRIVDARLWDAMTPMQQDAAVAVAMTFEAMGRGLGFAQVQFDRIPGARGASNPLELQGVLMTAYVAWARACQKEKISHAMIIDILCMGLTLTQSDQARRVRKGASRRNLLDGLDVYCCVRGWRRF